MWKKLLSCGVQCTGTHTEEEPTVTIFSIQPSQLCLKKHCCIKTCGRVDICAHVFLLVCWHYTEVRGRPHASAAFPQGKRRPCSFDKSWGGVQNRQFYREVVGKRILQTTQRHIPEDRNQEGSRLMIVQIHFMKDHRCNPLRIKRNLS
jgi:hypothetical protein